MPHIIESYKPGVFFRNGHIHTIYPALFRRSPEIRWVRERLTLTDGDFVDLDWLRAGKKRCVVLGHGLEGSTQSTYINTAAKLFSSHDFDVLSWNQRSCSGEMNRLPRFYHHGVTEDLHEVLQVTTHYDEVHYIGYSLGGNVMLKFLGEDKYPVPDNFVSGVAVSAPVDLPSCVETILHYSNKLYHDRFLKSLKVKVREKAAMMPGQISASHLRNVRTLVDFDRYYTAPLHGFDSPEDYYDRASSRPFLSSIRHPTMLLQAQDDPMMGEGCYPRPEAESSSSFVFVETRYGGHIAFTQPGKPWHWMEEVALDFILQNSSAD